MEIYVYFYCFALDHLEEAVYSSKADFRIVLQFLYYFQEADFPGVGFDIDFLLISGAQENQDDFLDNFIDVGGECHFGQKLEVEMGAFHLGDEVSHHTHL